ncbi:transcriptional regulator of acetoin/glycerol metabolism [Clostridiales Family XIII bacterium PM5-7]
MPNVNLNDPAYQKEVQTAWTKFIRHEDGDFSAVRPEIFESWTRSRNANVDPTKVVQVFLSHEELSIRLNKSVTLLNIVKPYVQRLYSVVEGTGAYILVSDCDGYLLYVIGDQDIVFQGSSISKLIPGACRSEATAGTNAIGTALALKKPIQLWGEEHYCERHKLFSCSCAPFYDENNNLLGAINITLLKESAHPHTLGMAISAADSITREIKLNNALENLEMLSRQRNMIIENMTAGALLLSPDGRISQTNTNALKMLDMNYEEVLGHNLAEILSIDSCNNHGKIIDFLSEECYNSEVHFTIFSQKMKTKRFNISINHVKNAPGEIDAILIRINKPEVIQKLVKRIEGYHAKYRISDIIGTSGIMFRMKQDCEKAAKIDSNVLILGPSGTGKELVAQSIHNASIVSDGPFVAINCAALPNNLVESELFGYEKGSFTGAAKEGRPGKFELADGGTIFLDEIGDMPLDVQATLLRVIQTKEVIRIGGTYPKPVNIRIIAATNQNLSTLVDEKMFRSDLFYRLNVFSIYTPALKERGGADIKLLADHFIQIYNENKGRSISVTPDVYPILQGYDWPGNVRQLENVIERAISLADDDLITEAQLPPYLYQRGTATSPSIIGAQPDASMNFDTPALVSTEEDFPSAIANEKALIISVLTKTQGRITETAKILDMNRRTLYRRMDKFGINPSKYRNCNLT